MNRSQKHKQRLPHFRVYARLGRSTIHGVGVFAIRRIRKGTPIFPGDDQEIIWVRKTRMRGLHKEVKRLYKDFCVVKDKGSVYGCPRNFNQLTPPWYLNSSIHPNVQCDTDFRFFALRDIKEGEELTVDYNSYNSFG
jgi:SET domain-containing protein